MSRISQFLAVLLVMLHPIASAEDATDFFNLHWDNDVLIGKDGHYTNGIRLSYIDTLGEGEAPAWATLIPVFDREPVAVTYSLQQLMVTPSDIENSLPQYDDLPYLGYLAFSAAVLSRTERGSVGYELSVGTIGPQSGAAATQREIHELLGSTIPQGWETQLSEDYTLGIAAMYARRISASRLDSGLQQEWTSSSKLTLSNWNSSIRSSVIWQLGSRLQTEELAEESVILRAGLPRPYDDPGWSVFVSAGAELIGYSYIEHEAPDYSFDPEPLVAHAALGATLHQRSFSLSLVLRASSSVQRDAKTPLAYGTITFSWAME